MKILLIHPSYWESASFDSAPPLGLGYIAAVLEKNGFEVGIIDSNPLKLTLKDIIVQIHKEKPYLVGIGCNTAYRYEAFELVREIKREMPAITTIMGGPHVSFLADQTLAQVPEIDFIVRGEGEITVLELAECLKEDKDFHNVKGISFRENGIIVSTPDRPFIADLDTVPFPAFHLLPLDKYSGPDDCSKEIKKLKYCSVITSRGCPIGCVFCASSAFWGKKFRPRSPKNVLDEIRYLVEEFGIEHIQFFDDTFAMNPLRAKEICRGIIDLKYDIKFRIMGRVDTMDDELIYLLKKAGCHKVDLGLETGSPEIMKKINKKLDLDLAEKTFKKCKEAGMEVKAFVMISLPGEREEDIQKTIDFVKRADIDHISLAVTAIFPGSELYNMAISKGMVDENTLLTYKSPGTDLTIKDVPPYLEYFSMNDLGYFIKLMRYEDWKKKGTIFYCKKVISKLSEPSKILNFLQRRIKRF